MTEPLDSSAEGQLIRYVKGYAAQIEREKIRERTMRGKRERALKGKLPTGGAGLYGYRYIKGADNGQGIRVINEEEAQVIRLVFHWLVDEDMTLGRIAIRLSEMGIPSPKGTPRWGRSTIGRLANQRAYTGTAYALRYVSVLPKESKAENKRHRKTRRELRPQEEWVEVPETTPAIITEDQFNAAQATLERHKKLSDRHTKAQYLLRGHVVCGLCGRSFYGTPDHHYRYYRCAGKRRIVSLEPCASRMIPADKLEENVWKRLRMVILEPERIVAQARKRQDQEDPQLAQTAAMLDERLKRLADREARLLRAYSWGEWDEATVKNELKTLQKERAVVQQERDRVQSRLSQIEVSRAHQQEVYAYCQRVAENIDRFGFEEKRLALAAFAVQVVVTGPTESDWRIEGLAPYGTVTPLS